MFAVVRETTYPSNLGLPDAEAFKSFQAAHQDLPGYRGSVIVAVGEGRHLTVALWESEGEMRAAREAIGPTVGATISKLMTREAKLLGTGPVVFDDVA